MTKPIIAFFPFLYSPLQNRIGQQCLVVLLGHTETLTHGEQCAWPGWQSGCIATWPCAHCPDSSSDVVVRKDSTWLLGQKRCYCRLVTREQRRGGSGGQGKLRDRKLVSRSQSTVMVWQHPSPSQSSLRPQCRIQTEMDNANLGVYNLTPPYSLQCLRRGWVIVCYVQQFG